MPRYGRQATVARETQAELEAKVPGPLVTPERRNHDPIENEVVIQDRLGFALIVRQRVHNRFMRLAEDGTLTTAEATAALQLRLYADAYYSGVSGPLKQKVDGTKDPEAATINRMHYAAVVQSALEHLNSELRKIAVCYVLEGIVQGYGHSFLSIGENYFPQISDKERQRIAGKALVIAMCRELAVFFRFQNSYDFDIRTALTGIRVRKGREARSRLLNPVRKLDIEPPRASR